MSGAASGRVLTVAELDALPVGAIVDATVNGARVRTMARGHKWALSEKLDSSWGALTDELVDAVLITDAPITPAPTRPLPTATGAVVEALVTRRSHAERVIAMLADDYWTSSRLVGGWRVHGPEYLSDWRIIYDPEDPK